MPLAASQTLRCVFNKVFVGAFLLVLMDSISNGQTRTSIRGLVLPLLIDKEPLPVAVIRADSIFTDYQRRGFFKIGLLPMAVAEGVTIDFRLTQQVTNVLAFIHPRFGQIAGKNLVELRRVDFKFPGETAPRLQAKRIHIGENGSWRLLDGVVVHLATNQVKVSQATLQTTGPSAGQLILESVNLPSEVNIFASDFAGKYHGQTNGLQ